MINLYDDQKKAIEKLRSGSILCGGTGSGKSIAALAYYIREECHGDFHSDESEHKRMETPKHLYVITTAKKRDTLEWVKDASNFCLPKNMMTIDSWNNIKNYIDIKDAFFIFDEQRVVGSGAWVKSFYKIAKKNNWILLSATPGDTWKDYIPVFVANGFYKNKTEFTRRHIVYNRFTKYPKIDHYVETGKLARHRNQVLVNMHYIRETVSHHKYLYSDYDQYAYDKVQKERWNVFKDEPIKDVSEWYYTRRRIVNSDPSRIEIVKTILNKHPKVIIFYNFNYELNLLLQLGEDTGIPTAQLNGRKHQEIPTTKTWMYLVQYAAGAEAWNCIETDTIIFYSQNYSYRATKQAAGRIDRRNTPFVDLYYYHILSKTSIDGAIAKALKQKKNFNETGFEAT